MNYIFTLAATDSLSENHIETAQKYFKIIDLSASDAPVWLSQNKAADIEIANCLTIAQIKELRQIFDEDKIDVFCTSIRNRKKSLFLADMDSTIVTTETLDELAAEAGIKDKIAKITERAMRGELDFHAALKERVRYLKDLSEDAVKRTLKDTEISKGASALISKFRAENTHCVLVSGGFTYFTSDIAQKLGFHAHHGNILNIKDGLLTGTVGEPILDKDAKLRYLKLYCDELGLDLSETAAIGDGANDLPMLEAAGIGFGYHPKPILEDKLLNCIRHTDLTSVLYAQGYTL